MISFDRLKATIQRHEGLRLKPYHCPAGKLTIGIGRNIEDKGITIDEATTLLNTDIGECLMDLERIFELPQSKGEPYKNGPWDKMNGARQEALINMRFQLGSKGFKRFRRMLKGVKAADWETAAREALDSAWAKQTPSRAQEVAEVLRTGKWH